VFKVKLDKSESAGVEKKTRSLKSFRGKTGGKELTRGPGSKSSW